MQLDNTLRPRNFTVLMFGKKASISRYFSDSHTVLSIYKGKDRSEPTAERHLLTGTLIEQARKSIELLNTESYMAFDKQSEKPNQVKYPIRALQEAVVNAVVHRDYEILEPIRITVFSDRIEIRSPGALHWAVDKDKFLKGKASPKWRNQSLAYLFNRMQLSQSEGQGIPTILRSMKEEGCPDPIFEIGQESVTCTLPAHPRHQLMQEIGEIQDSIVLEHYREAKAQVLRLMDQDPYNFRTFDLLAEICLKTKDTTGLYQVLKEKNIELNTLNINTIMNIIDVLAMEKDDRAIQEYTANALRKAAAGKLEERQIVRATYSMMKMAEPEAVIRFIDESMVKYPKLWNHPRLLEQRATARMELAKKCFGTGTDKKSTQRTKERAWAMYMEFLRDAEKDLNLALERVVDLNDRSLIERDKGFLAHMKVSFPKPSS